VSPTATPRHPWRRRGLKLLLAGVLIGVLVAEGISIGPYLGRALRAVSDPDPFWLTIAVLAELVSLSGAAHVQRRMLLAGGTHVTRGRMTALTYTANAVSATLPAGPALSSGYTFRRMRDWGASVPLAVFALISSFILSSIAFAGLVVAAVIVAKTGSLGPALVGVALAMLVVALIVGRRYFQHPDELARLAERLLGWGNRILRREPTNGLVRLRELVADFTQVKPRKRDWAAGLGFACVNWGADLLCLIAASRAVNMHASLALIVAAYVAGMSTSGISLLPGGLGIVDGAIILVLTRGHIGTVAATASVLLYRLVSYAFNVVLGWLIWSVTWYLARRRTMTESILAELATRPEDLTVECSLRS
jgi:putative heme transporter